MKKIILIFLIIFFTSPIYAIEPGLHDHATYWNYSGDTITAKWSTVNNATEYEVLLIHVETDQVTALGKTPNIQISFVLKRVGHYFLKLRALNDVGESPWTITSESENCRVNGEPRSFWIYAQIPPIEDLILE